MIEIDLIPVQVEQAAASKSLVGWQDDRIADFGPWLSQKRQARQIGGHAAAVK